MIADIDVVVNDGKYQPGCELQILCTPCSHFAAFILRELIIVRSKELPRNDKGLPIAKRNGQNPDEFVISFTDPPVNKSGIYHMNTGMVFEAGDGICVRIAKLFGITAGQSCFKF